LNPGSFDNEGVCLLAVPAALAAALALLAALTLLATLLLLLPLLLGTAGTSIGDGHDSRGGVHLFY
jgi:hypothetical protein